MTQADLELPGIITEITNYMNCKQLITLIILNELVLELWLLVFVYFTNGLPPAVVSNNLISQGTFSRPHQRPKAKALRPDFELII